MALNCVKLGRTVTFMKYFASVVTLIFLPKTLIWNKITFPALSSLNFERWKVSLRRVTTKKFTNILFSIQFIATCCKDFKSL